MQQDADHQGRMFAIEQILSFLLGKEGIRDKCSLTNIDNIVKIGVRESFWHFKDGGSHEM